MPPDRGTPGFLATDEQKAFVDHRGQEERVESVGQKAAQIAVPLAILAGVALNLHIVSLAPGLDFFSRMIAIAAGSLSALFGAAMAVQRTAIWATNAAMILMALVSFGLIVIGQGQLGILVLLCTTVSWSLAIPVVNWCLGPPVQDLPPGANIATYRAHDPTNPYKNPVAQALVAGAILFSIPSSVGGSLLAGLVFLGSVLAITSLGSMAERTRGAAGDTTVDGRFFSRWAPICAILVVIAILLSMLFGGAFSAFVSGSSPTLQQRYGEMFGVDPRGQGVTVPRPGASMNPGGARGERLEPGNSGPEMPAPTPGEGQPSNPQPAPPPPPPPPPDFAAMAPQLLAMIVVALVLAFLLKRYGGAIWAFLAKVWNGLLAPFREWRARREAARRAIRLALLTREERGKLGNAYVYQPSGDLRDDAGQMLHTWSHLCGAAGLTWKETDTALNASKRVAASLSLPADTIQPIGEFIHMASYGLPDRAAQLKPRAEEALAGLQDRLSAKFGETWGHRKEVHLDQVAEKRAQSRLDAELGG